jgi:hypothetical protein
MPKPSLPNSIPTPKKRSKAGRPKRKPALPAIILKKKIIEATNRIASGFSKICNSWNIG